METRENEKMLWEGEVGHTDMARKKSIKNDKKAGSSHDTLKRFIFIMGSPE